ncbi:MAG: YfcC family protein [Acidobacteriia bacterium]|nr:YfcC family protein [Terriglobia bacterium]
MSPSKVKGLPHPLILLLLGVVVAAALTWILPPGAFDRRDDPATGRRVVVSGTYHSVARAPVGPLAAAIAVPRGFVAGADVIAVVLFVGGAWVVVDRIGSLPALVAMLVGRFRRRGLWAIPVVSLFFATMGALENMQEEIIPLVPVLLVLGLGLGVDAVVVVAMSAGAAMIGSAFGPTNPFQAGIAMKLAQLPPLAGGGLRLAMFIIGLTVWIVWTIAYARRNRVTAPVGNVDNVDNAASATGESALPAKHALVLAVAIAPMAAYVYGALRLDWGFNELSGAFLVAGLAAGLIGGLGPTGTLTAYLEGAQRLLPAALMIGAARSISLVLEDGHVVDTILNGLVAPLSHMPPVIAALMQIPVQALVHVAVPSVSGQAVLTMPLVVPLADLLGVSRQVPVLAYQTGAGLMELLTPTNGALMAVLLAAGVPFQKWIRFVAGGVVLATLLGMAAIAVTMWR